MKNKIVLTFLAFASLCLIAKISYQIALETPDEDFSHSITSHKENERKIKNKKESSIKKEIKQGKKKIVADKEVNSVNLQILTSTDIEQLANDSDSMTQLIDKLQKKEKLPTSLSLNLILSAITNFEMEIKNDLFFNEKSPYLKLLKAISTHKFLDKEAQLETEWFLENEKTSHLTSIKLLKFLQAQKSIVEQTLESEKYSNLRQELNQLNNFIDGNNSISSLETFESLYTQKVCNSDGDSFIEKVSNVKTITGKSLKAQQQRIYEYLLKTLPSRIPVSKKYERHIYAAFNSLHVPIFSNNNLNTNDYYLSEVKKSGFNDVELTANFYNMQNKFYQQLNEDGKKYLSSKLIEKASVMKSFFERLNDAQRKVPKADSFNLILSDKEKEVINFDLPKAIIVNTIGMNDRCIQLKAILSPSASLKVQLFNKKLPRVIIPYYKKTNFKDLITEK